MTNASGLPPLAVRFAQAFAADAKAMIADLERIRTLNDHRTVKGNSLEDAVRNFLRAALQLDVQVVSGEVVDRNNQISTQLDVVVRPSWHPAQPETLSLNDGVYAVGEVKAVLNKDSLYTSAEAARTYRKLHFQQPAGFFSKAGEELRRPPYFLWAFENSMEVDTTWKHITELGHRDLPIGLIICLHPMQCWVNSNVLTQITLSSNTDGWLANTDENALFNFIAALSANMPIHVPTVSLWKTLLPLLPQKL